MARIIVADDDELLGEIARDALIDGGHAAALLTNGADALKVIKARIPDLVVLDCNMPDLGGLLILREMRNTLELCDVPALILTGRQSDRDVGLAMYAGANDYMKKPFEPDELLFRVDELLAQQRQRVTRQRP